MSAVLIEAEQFHSHGGWTVDSQHIDQMGSTYLLAHGLGEPVADARTRFAPRWEGEHHVWARTRDWCGEASKAAGSSPGIFRLQVDGELLPTTFGAGQADWHWEYGGSAHLAASPTELRLQDLTGFDGRVDAILFSRNRSCPLPDDGPDLHRQRRHLLGLTGDPAVQQFDLTVVGGGIAGICAAVAAARKGLSVALLQDRPVLGGNSSSEVRVAPVSDRNLDPYPALGNLVRELEGDDHGLANDGHKQAIVAAEPNVSLYLNTRVVDARVEDGRITVIVGRHVLTGEETAFSSPLFADCTGDANLGYLAGADYRVGREAVSETGEEKAPAEADNQVLGASLGWRTVMESEASVFPVCPWALPFTEESCQHAIAGAWNWETGFRRDMVTEGEEIRDHMLRAIYGNWSFQKNHSAKRDDYARRRLVWVAHILGKRESRRLLGDVIWSQHEIDNGREYPDSCVTCRWGIDLHYPDPKNGQWFPGEEFRAVADHDQKEKHPPVSMPYRSFYSRNIQNLFMAGRCASFTHIAHGMFRTQRTTGMMGEVVGIAAGLCREKDASPREVYERHLSALRTGFQEGV